MVASESRYGRFIGSYCRQMARFEIPVTWEVGDVSCYNELSTSSKELMRNDGNDIHGLCV